MLSPLIKSVSESELLYIAELDYGQNAHRHLESLRAVILDQDGSLRAKGKFGIPMRSSSWGPMP